MKTGMPVGSQAPVISSSEIRFGRSLLLNWTTRGIFSISSPTKSRLASRFLKLSKLLVSSESCEIAVNIDEKTVGVDGNVSRKIIEDAIIDAGYTPEKK